MDKYNQVISKLDNLNINYIIFDKNINNKTKYKNNHFTRTNV